MDLPLSASTLRIGVFFALISVHMTWLRLLNTRVPVPYLDEVFHIPQAQTYWAGNWSDWDDKITTPPGLYLWSYLFVAIRRVTALDPAVMVTVEELRFSNAMLVYVLLVTLYVWVGVARRDVAGDDEERVLHREMVLLAFPLLAFFSGLYYTDVFSAWSVVATLVAWETSRRCKGGMKLACQAAHLVLGLISLSSRQTNIFWVAVFVGGLQVVDTIQADATVDVLNDPEVSVATIEDVFHFISRLVPNSLTRIPHLIVALWPQLTLLASFAAFVVWNGGVVLGDKSNHVATIHLPQLLYIWPCMVFFSWPTLLPQLRGWHQIPKQLPRPWLAMLIMLVMTMAVHYNTIVHPFTLADNRHYVFYVFKILMRKWWIKYAAVPAYFVCACLVLGALGGGIPNKVGDDSTVKLSFALVWFASTALSLISAPLVEPRYFIVPWLVWRIYLPGSETRKAKTKPSEGEKPGHKSEPPVQPGMVQRALELLGSYALWIELVWYLAVNYATGWMFLNRGFEWTQEPGMVQRFMW